MIIDANLYYIPEELFEDENMLRRFLAEVPAKDGWYAYCAPIEGGEGLKQIVLEKPKGCQNLNYAQHDYILKKQLADLDAAGADAAVLKTPCCQEWMSLELCRYFNDHMAEHAKKSGGRLFPLAVVPPYGTEENLQELERCHKEFGMNAVQLSAHYGDAYLDDERFAAFFEKLNELHMNAYVHHTPVPVEYASFYEYNNVRRSYGRIVDQGLAIGREVFSGFFEKYPNVKLVHSMLGGGFFAIRHMMFPQKAKSEAVSRFESNSTAEEQFLDHIYFEMSHAQPWGENQLECAIRVLGADHILFGSSYPVRREWLTGGTDFVKGLAVSEEEKRMILGENAERLYGLQARRTQA